MISTDARVLRQLAMVLLPLLFTLATSTYAGDRFERFSVDQGLSQNTVTAMVQDSQGFLWFGTQNGLNRFDGYQFRVFHHDADNPKSLSSSFILSLVEDKQGFIWIGTFGGGLNRFDPVTEQFERFEPHGSASASFGDSQIIALHQSNGGKLLIGTLGKGLFTYHFKSNVFTQFVHDSSDPTSISNNNIWSIVQDNQNRIWIGTSLGFDLFDENKDVFKRHNNIPGNINSLSDNRVVSISPDDKANLWIATSGGLNYFEPSNGNFTSYQHNANEPSSLSDNRVHSVLVDNIGRVWIGTDVGLDRWVPGTKTFIHFSHNKEDPHSISGNIIDGLMMSKDNILWIGTYVTGLAKYNPLQEQFSHYKHKTKVVGSLSGNDVWSFAQDADGTLWVGTDGGGLNYFDAERNVFSAYKHDPKNDLSISNNRVYGIAFDQQKRLWLSNYDGGVNRLDPQNNIFKRYRHNPSDKDSLSSDASMTVFVDSKNRVWVGTYRGLNLYNDTLDNFTRFIHQPDDDNSLSNSAILSIQEDSKGNLWIGTYGGGLNKMDEQQQFTRYRHDSDDLTSLSHDIVTSSLEDKLGDLWVTTYGGGLNKLDIATGKFIRFGVKEGLANIALNAILQDSDGNFWVSSATGLSVLFAESMQFTNYTVLDGLQGGEFNAGGAFQSDNGEMFFGGTDGFNRFHPINIKRPLFNMPMSLTQLRVTNFPISIGQKSQAGIPYLTKSINHTQSLSLSYLDDLFSFEFSALGYARPSQTEYAYKLENWDEDYIYTDYTNRRATYTNIPSGEYTLKVKARGPDGNWDSSMVQLNINISTPPWQTWWAYLCYFITIGSIIGFIIWQRQQKFRQIRASQKRLSLALWSSGNELWDWERQSNQIVRIKNDQTLLGNDGFELLDKRSLKPHVHQDDFDSLWAAIVSHQNGESEFIDVTYRIKGSHDQWRWVRNRAKAVEHDTNGQVSRIIGTIDDVQLLKQTQSDLQALNVDLESRVADRTAKLTTAFNSLKQTQQELVESEKLAALGSLVVGIAHELNTPLGITVTAATQIEHTVNTVCELKKSKALTLSAFKQFESRTKTGLELLLNNLHRTSRLVEDFKSLAMETDSNTGKPFDLSSLLEEIKTLKKHVFTEHQIDMQVKCENHISMVSHADAIKKVFEQLINNAIAHAFDAVSQRQLTITVLQADDKVRLVFSDNGNGLAIEALNQIFEPFYTTKRGSNCTGLGMLIVHNLVVHKLAGTIVCASEPRQGLRVNITIPQMLG